MQIIYTELKDTFEYTCDVNVFNVSMIMRVSYNSRSKKRLISLTSLDGGILYLKPTYITYGSRIFPNFNAIIDGLSFYITLDRLTLTGDNYLNWANQFRLCFVEYVPFEKGEGWYLAENSLEENSLTPVFGDWILNQGFTILGDDIRYTGYKTNGIDTYDSFALSSLQNALVKSFLDPDLQQYAAFTTAVEQLIGDVDWVLDPTNNQIKYKTGEQSYSGFTVTGFSDTFTTPQETCSFYLSKNTAYKSYKLSEKIVDQSLHFGFRYDCKLYFESNQTGGSMTGWVQPTQAEEEQPKTLPLDVVAAQVISNADSSADEILKLLSEDYIEIVVNSIFDTNVSKQFVKLSDLVDQFEENKTLRS